MFTAGANIRGSGDGSPSAVQGQFSGEALKAKPPETDDFVVKCVKF